MSKRRDRPYRAGRSPNWVKVKNRKHPAIDRSRKLSHDDQGRILIYGGKWARQCPESVVIFAFPAANGFGERMIKKGRELNVDNDEQQLPVDRKQRLWPG